MSTLTPQLDFPPASSFDFSLSPFAKPLETIAPGIGGLIQNSQAQGEEWSVTLMRIAPSLAATNEQRTLLLEQAKQAQKGGDPLPLPAADDPGQKLETKDWLKYAGIGIVLWKLLA